MSVSTPSRLRPKLGGSLRGVVEGWNRIGAQTRFYVKTLAAIPDAVTRYHKELLRLIAQMGLGAGALAVVGGTVAIVGFLTRSEERRVGKECRL